MPDDSSNTAGQNSRRTVLKSGAVIGGSVLAGCLGGSDDSSGAIDVGTLPVLTLAFISKPAYMEEELEERDLEINLHSQGSAADIVSLVSQGELDLGGGSFSAAFLNAVDNDLPISLVAPQHSLPPQGEPVSDPVVASEASGVTEMADFEGETVATSGLGASSYWMVARALDQGGLTPDDVEIRTMPFPDMIPAMNNEAIAGGLLPEPLATLADNNIGITRVAEDYAPLTLVTGTMYNTDWASENPQAAQDFMEVYLIAVREIQDNWTSDENASLIADFTDLEEDLVRNVVSEHPPFCDQNLQLQEEIIMEMQNFLINQGETGYEDPIPFDEFADLSYSQEAIDNIGEA